MRSVRTLIIAGATVATLSTVAAAVLPSGNTTPTEVETHRNTRGRSTGSSANAKSSEPMASQRNLRYVAMQTTASATGMIQVQNRCALCRSQPGFRP